MMNALTLRKHIIYMCNGALYICNGAFDRIWNDIKKLKKNPVDKLWQHTCSAEVTSCTRHG